MKYCCIFLLILLTLQYISFGQSRPFVSLPDQLNSNDFAEWISPASEAGDGLFFFRKAFQIQALPEKFIVHVSADNRYRLFVNDSMVCWGPAAGDLLNWNYETIDIASYLKVGANLIAAIVWNQGDLSGAKQISHRTAFILQAENKLNIDVNTNNTWVVTKDEGYHCLHMSSETVGGGYIAGGTDSLIANLRPWGWKELHFDDSNWQKAIELGKGNHLGLDTWLGTPWLLKPRSIPAMEQRRESIAKLLEIKGLEYDKNYNGQLELTIPANSTVELLFDNEQMTMGFPLLHVSGGEGSIVKIQYQEALYDAQGKKGNRNEWQGKTMKGYYDVFLPDGGNRVFEPLWIRTFRYVKLTINTTHADLKIHGFSNLFTSYPFKQLGQFSSENEKLGKIWDVSWRTARLCALETYMDCPYYEQLQYIGDTRIQALISYYIAGDDRLAKNAISQFYGSMQPMGLTKSSHPQGGVQIIPPFSLIYINMMHDYFMLRDDSLFIKQYIPGMKFILDWFVTKIDNRGILGPLPYWNHVDGGTSFKNGSPPGVGEGGSAHISILLAHTLDNAVAILEHYGYACDAEYFQKISASLKENTLRLCFDHTKQLLAETPDKNTFSQQTNSIAILADVFDEKMEKIVANRMLEDKSLVQATLYFNFYVFQALKKVGFGDRIIDLMAKWNVFIENGFTTFPEHGIESRSDCHAWSAHPMYDFLNITCGIESASPGFQTVIIKPQPGQLANFEGSIPHQLGTISVKFKKENKEEIQVYIKLPKGLKGAFLFNEKEYPIKELDNYFVVKSINAN